MHADRLIRLLPLAAICFLSSCNSAPSPHSRPGTYTVGLDLSGDGILRKQFALTLQHAFVGTNFELASAGKPDTTVSGTLNAATEPRERGMSVFRQQVTTDGETRTVALCSTTYSNYDAATRDSKIFETDPPEAAREVKAFSPKAKTVYLDPAGSFQLSPPIMKAFVSALQQKGLAITSAPNADIADRVTLSLDKITTIGRTLHYRLSMDGLMGGEELYGAHWLQGETTPQFPTGCEKPIGPLPAADTSGVDDVVFDVKHALNDRLNAPSQH